MTKLHDSPTVSEAEATRPILTKAQIDMQLLLLAALHSALAERNIRCVLARTHRLVLRYSAAPLAASGPTEPQLYVFFIPGQKPGIVTTDGVNYRFGSDEFPVDDPVAAAVAICAAQPASS
jgi:hypothetical protein